MKCWISENSLLFPLFALRSEHLTDAPRSKQGDSLAFLFAKSRITLDYSVANPLVKVNPVDCLQICGLAQQQRSTNWAESVIMNTCD